MSTHPPIVALHGPSTTRMGWEKRIERDSARGHELAATAAMAA